MKTTGDRASTPAKASEREYPPISPNELIAAMSGCPLDAVEYGVLAIRVKAALDDPGKPLGYLTLTQYHAQLCDAVQRMRKDLAGHTLEHPLSDATRALDKCAHYCSAPIRGMQVELISHVVRHLAEAVVTLATEHERALP